MTWYTNTIRSDQENSQATEGPRVKFGSGASKEIKVVMRGRVKIAHIKQKKWVSLFMLHVAVKNAVTIIGKRTKWPLSFCMVDNVEQLWNTAIRDSPGDCNQTCGCVSDVCITTRLLPQPVYHSWGMRWTAGSYSNINKVSDPSWDDEFHQDGILAARKGVTMVNQMAASRCMGLIRTLEMRLKERPSNRLKCICHNCWEQLIQCRPQKRES